MLARGPLPSLLLKQGHASVLRCLRPLSPAFSACKRMEHRAPFFPTPASWFRDFTFSCEGEKGDGSSGDGTEIAASTSSQEAKQLQQALKAAQKVTVLTGAGVSAESGIPTFRGQGGLWRQWSATELATPEAFASNPSLVWEFYHYRRGVVASARPNNAHASIAALQRRCEREGKAFTLLTQNIDGLHTMAGSTGVVELHGSLWRTRCVRCGDERENRDQPVCPALEGKGEPDPAQVDARIPTADLPRCQLCNGLLRPDVVWFGERLSPEALVAADRAVEYCDVMLVVGTSAIVQPAGGYAMIVRGGGGLVAEFNIEDTPLTSYCSLKFRGPSAVVLPEALGLAEQDLQMS